MLSEIQIIIEKNIRRLIRSKISALIVLLGPLFMMFLIGIAFNNSGLYGIRVGVYSNTYDNVTNSLIDNIKSRDFRIIKEKDKESCINSVKEGSSHLCVVFPNGTDQQKRLEFHVDYSKLNLVYTLLNILSAGISEQSMQISLGLTQDLLNTLKETSSSIKSNVDIVRNLQKNIQDVGFKITEINENIDGLDVSFTLESTDIQDVQDQIDQTENELTSLKTGLSGKLGNYQSKLNFLEGDVQELEDELEKQKEETDEVKKDINDVYARMNCTSTEQIFSEWDVDIISTKISESSDPSCALLHSMITVIDERAEVIDDALIEINSIQNEIDTAQEDLEDADSDIDSIYSNTKDRMTTAESSLNTLQSSIYSAKTKVEEINSLKNNLQGELNLVQNTISVGLNDLNTFNSTLNSIITSLDSLSIATPESIVKPIVSEIKPLMTKKTSLDYIFPSLVILVITFISILLSSTIIMKEKSSSAYFRNFITPVPNILFILGTYLTSLLLVLLQCFILFIVAYFFFNVQLFSNIFNIAIALLIISSIFIFMGMIIGYIFKSEETTTLASISLACILFFFSSLIIPLEMMKSGTSLLAKASPFVLSEIILRQLIIFQSSFAPVLKELSFLLIYFVALFILVVLTKKMSKHFIEE